MAIFAVIKYAGRCGSHWLKSCMVSHPDVFMPKNEQFDIDKEYWRHPKKWQRLIANVFDNFGGCDSHGCVVKANFVGDPLWKEMCKEIAKIENIHIILNSRRDYLAQYLSLVIADITGQFNSFLDPIRAHPIEIDCTLMFKSFRNWDKKTNLYKEIFIDLPTYHLYYEDMENTLDKTIKDIYRFIGVNDSHKPKFKTKKQRLKTTKEMIINYDDIIKNMKDSQWSCRLPDHSIKNYKIK